MPDEPAIRAAITKDFLAIVRESEGALLQRTVAAAPAAAIADVDHATRLGWVALRDHVRINDTVRQLVGDAAFRALWRRSMLRSFEQSTLKPLMDGALRLFGATPSGLSKIAPRAWALVSRAAGDLALEAAPGSNTARIALVGLPVDIFASRTFAVGLAGCMECLYDLCSVAGEVTIAREDPTSGSALYELRWK